MKQLAPNLAEDNSWRVNRVIDNYGDNSDFPRLSDTGFDKEALDDYLFDYQAIIDSEGTDRTQLTVYGIIALLPLFIASAFPENALPWGRWSLLMTVLLGVLLAAFVRWMVKLMKQRKLKKLRAEFPELAHYVEQVLDYEYKHNN